MPSPFASYRRVLSRPGAAAFSGAALVGRMPISMMTLAVVLLVTAETGSYTRAGQLSAAFVVANAVVAVPQGRLLDRRGQRPVLLATSLLFALGCGLLGYGVLHGWAAPWPHLAAVLAGASMPQVGSSVRARWAHLLGGTDGAGADKQTAFALEAVADEVVFMSGPTIATFLATLVAPVAGLVAAVVLGTVGTVGLALQRCTEPPAQLPRRSSSPGPARTTAPMPWLRLLTLTLAGAATGSLFGATEVATVAFAEESGRPAVSGVLLACWALGSLVAGLVTGTIAWRTSSVVRLRVGAAFLTVAMLPTPFLPGPWSMGAVLLVAGMAISPTLIAAISRVEETVPAARLTEGMGLMQAGLGAGIAPGAALAGRVVDAAGGSAAYWVGIASAALAVLAATLTPQGPGHNPCHPVGAETRATAETP